MGGVAELPKQDVVGPSDHQLVALVRRGDDRAFESLYQRYNRRIQAYVFGMCKDHARAEDITQEVFVSALRRMRETERPIAFKPWIYEIAKNACIDQHRRARRAEEVSLQADDGLCPADYGRLVNSDPGPDALVAAKQELDHLCGAFGGLSETHHDILVMRELEGLSYREIGERLGMSRPAVESTLFRARRRLTEEYDELVSGQRCQRIQGIIAEAATGRLGARDTRRLARHVAHCQACRREAIAAGVDSAVLRQPLRTRVARKVAALLPFPVLTRRAGSRGADEAAGAVASSSSSSGGGGWLAHLPAISDQLGAGWAKAAAAAAVLLAGVGAGVGTQVHRDGSHVAARPPAAHDRGTPAGDGGVIASGGPVVSQRSETGAAGRTLHRSTAKHRARAGAAGRGAADGGTQPQGGGGAGTPAAAPAAPTDTVTDAVTRTTGGSGGDDGSVKTPVLETPAAATSPSLSTTVQSTGDAVDGAADTVTGTTGAAGGAVDDATSGATAPVTGAVQDTAEGTTDTVTGLTP